MKTKRQKDMQKSIKAKKRAELRLKVRKTWNEVKDTLLLLILLNILIGLLQQVDISSLTASKTIIIERETIINTVEASEDKKEEKEQEKAKFGEFTAYSKGDGYTPSDTMASTKKVYEGAIACPVKYEFGTKVEVNGKTYTCEDRMAKRFRDGEYFDIYMDDIDQAKEFGRQKLEYKVIL